MSLRSDALRQCVRRSQCRAEPLRRLRRGLPRYRWSRLRRRALRMPSGMDRLQPGARRASGHRWATARISIAMPGTAAPAVFPAPRVETCVNGKCRGTGTSSAQCASGLTDCDGVCVDLTSNMNHCGACDAACESGLVPVACRSGVCERATCPWGRSTAARSTAAAICSPMRTTAGRASVGARAARARMGSARTAGPTCPSGQADCGEGCTDLSSNDFHCGACGNACDVGQVCQDGVCTGV